MSQKTCAARPLLSYSGTFRRRRWAWDAHQRRGNAGVLGGRHEARMRTVSGIGRVAAVAAVVAAVVLVGFIMLSGGGGYTVTAYFQNGNQLVKGNQVELDGTPIG